jgi:hypothetical protein
MQTLRAGAAYFALVFAAGFFLGAIRTLWVVPLVGVRYGELMESPLMLAAIIVAARRVARNPLAVGFLALAFLLIAEIGVTVGLRRLSIGEYIAGRDPVSGTVYLVLLLAFAVMPRLMFKQRAVAGPALLDPFIPHPDIRERHEIVIDAPAPLVFATAREFDMQSRATVRTIFWVRAKLLGEQTAARRPQGFIADMLALGWARLAEEPGRYFIAGAACQPWNANPVFTPIPPGEFASFAEPDRVKIVWTLEADATSPTRTRFATETRVVATDDAARAKFRWYWRKFGIGIVLIRRLLLGAVRRAAEASQIRK